jgi:aminoglycoside 6'-N-acetyltransferase
MRVEDAADLAERRSDPETAEYQAWIPPYPVERAVELIEELIALGAPTTGEWFQFALERQADGVVVGDVALRLDGDGRNGEIGFTLHRWARGHGYATEASIAVLEYGFTELNLHRFEASIDPRNTASAKVLDRLGFRLEGTLIESYWLGDVVTDDARYGLLRREWQGGRREQHSR